MKEKNKGGQPPKVLTDEQVAEVEELSSYLTTGQIADYFGISRPTFNAIQKRQPEVLLRYKKGKASKIKRFAKIIEEHASGIHTKKDLKENEVEKEVNVACLMFWLKTRGEGAWKETQSIETKDITEEKQETTTLFDNMTTEEADKVHAIFDEVKKRIENKESE